MKNIHILPTDRPSRLAGSEYITNEQGIDKRAFKLKLWDKIIPNKDLRDVGYIPQHIYITNDESLKKGKEDLGSYYLDWKGNITKKQNSDWQITFLNDFKKKIILTTDPDLIKEGVQSIDDGFLEWFVKNPSCEEVDVKYNYVCSNCNEDKNNPKYENCHGNYRTHKIFKIIIPKEEPKVINGGDEIVFPSSTTITFKSKQEKCIYCENKGYIENYTGSSKIDCLQCNIIKEEPNQEKRLTDFKDEVPCISEDLLAKMWKDAIPKTSLDKLPFPEFVKEFAEYYKNVPLVEEPKEEPNFYEKLVEYFKNTPREKVLEDWNKTAECDNIGPTVEEFLGNTEETLEQAAIRLYPDNIIKLGNETSYNAALLKRKDFIDGGNWVKERMYSEEDMREAIHESRMQDDKYEDCIFEQFKKK